MDEEKLEVERDYADEADCACEANAAPLTKEEKLKRFKTKLENELKRRLEQIEIDAEFDKIRKEFNEAHADEFKRIEEYNSRNRLRYVVDEADEEPNKTSIPIEDIDELKRRYKELEARQVEILETSTDVEKLKNTPTDQMNAMVDEYISAEKLKLILVDRIRGALTNRRINLNCDKFSKFNLSFKAATDND